MQKRLKDWTGIIGSTVIRHYIKIGGFNNNFGVQMHHCTIFSAVSLTNAWMSIGRSTNLRLGRQKSKKHAATLWGGVTPKYLLKRLFQSRKKQKGNSTQRRQWCSILLRTLLQNDSLQLSLANTVWSLLCRGAKLTQSTQTDKEKRNSWKKCG